MSVAFDSLLQPASLVNQLIPALPLASFMSVVLGWLMAFLSVFLILLILIQRGKGGGLTGALGGPGGQSAFGSKAGDTFTAITVGTAAVWALVCAFAMYQLGAHAPAVADTSDSQIQSGPGDDVEDITSGLVVPTGADRDEASDLEAAIDSFGSLSSGDSDAAESAEEAEPEAAETTEAETTSDEETP
ncbi:preprotein translocase subunit SecG [Rhodopirellula baltica]|uniref:Protein-export membrane protein SecG n=1 Tax=Rhodopirellula baltica WH47 TaxID=991778 RepID=F2ASW5_RHOBT|nr:preprotein translocase subunit SecG [Rhodopirellula baltica]EGF27258.1 Preprotein translocase SecG subunit [Rhodopirellula baltica WH47]